MTWANIILYMTSHDAKGVLSWINEEECVAWITRTRLEGGIHHWKAVDRLDVLPPQEYALWHKESGLLNIPSGSHEPDSLVADPYSGWAQHLEEVSSRPWFGSNPGPYWFTFCEHGREASGSLARSEFAWPGDHYRAIGMPADPRAKAWWQRLKRFVRANATPIPWPYHGTLEGRKGAYAFEDAYSQMKRGRRVDTNP